jgi:hypothetical protein
MLLHSCCYADEAEEQGRAAFDCYVATKTGGRTHEVVTLDTGGPRE